MTQVVVGVPRLVIERCSDPLLWYAPLVGKTVPNLGWDESLPGWWSREPAGYKNIVRAQDASAVVVGVEVTVPPPAGAGVCGLNGTG